MSASGSASGFDARQVLVVGQRLAPVAQEGLPGARFELAAPDRLDVLASLHAAMELVLIDAEAVDAAALVAAINAMAARPLAPAVILAGAHLPAALVRALMKLPRSDVIEAPFTSVDLGRAAAALLAVEPPAAPAAANARCWTVMGSVGGCGATTIAIELATALARRDGAQRVALVDLNLVDGAAAAYLGATPAMHLAEASSAPDRIDAALLGAFSVRVDEGVDLLAAPRDAKAFARVSQTAVCRVLDVACQVYDWIVVDLPRHHQPWTLDVLAGSDEVLVVSELTVPALLSARSLAAEIEAELPEAAPPRVILNRLASRVFGPAPSLAEAEKALQRKADGGITSDWEAAAASVNLGGSISHHRPRSKIVRDIGVLVDRLAPPDGVKLARRA
ncbi:MAG TPA: cellulose synthase operon protein YhjQ/BcsQ [Caulobacteraceae bacterium]|jgi:pilus assembly protein CpaE